MKLLIEYDGHGNIHSIAARSTTPSGGNHFDLCPRPGHRVAELEAEHVTHDQDIAHIRETKMHYRVDSAADTPRLMRK